jgi:hypothetical protein
VFQDNIEQTVRSFLPLLLFSRVVEKKPKEDACALRCFALSCVSSTRPEHAETRPASAGLRQADTLFCADLSPMLGAGLWEETPKPLKACKSFNTK